MKKTDNIIVVGGGTAGCISALILKSTFSQKNITIIESSNVGIVGVGESSTEHWSAFCNYVGINQLDPIIHCNATFKFGVYFENWSKNSFVHSVVPPYSDNYFNYFGIYAYLISQIKDSKHSLCDTNSIFKDISLNNFDNLNSSPTKQYHFDTFALNEFLHRKCIENGIKVIVDDLVGVNLNSETGDLENVYSKKSEYNADFFIDCSGFSKLLLNLTYNIPWISYSEYLPVNSAISFSTDEMEEYNSFTKSTARSSGWSWAIPTQNRTGNGYVYCDEFIDKDSAIREMEDAYGQKLNISKEFKFDPGRLKKAWYKNCYAVGLSQSFVEPLEATSIGSIIQQMFCFVHFLPSYDYDSCNDHVNQIFDNIVDYIQAHYLVKREDTSFWKEIKYNLKITPSLQNHLEKWKNRMPLFSDINCAWGMFNSVNYIQILHGLNWFDIDKISDEYSHYRLHLEYDIINKLESISSPSIKFGHKKFIKEVLIAGYSQ